MDEAVFWGSLRLKNEETRAERMHIGELVRGAALRLFNLQLKPKDRIKDPRAFWPMPWDEPESEAAEVKRLGALTSEERQQEIEKFLAKTGQRGNQ